MPGTPASQTVRVGVYDYAPLVFSENGQPRGFFIDMLSDLAQRERWRLVFVPGTWAESLSRLEAGEIDLLPSIAQTPERDTLFRFTEDFLFLDWGVVYKKKGSAIRTVLDLEGKAITALDGSIYTEKLKALLEQFGIKAVIVPKPDYAETLAAVARGEADAGVCPNILGTILDRKLDITRTDIVFAPIKLRWAVKRGGREDLLPSLDRHLEELKALPGSLYHQSHDKWLGLAAASALPRWLPWTLGIGLLALCVLTVFVISLRLLVQRRTEALRESELHFRTLADSGQALIWTSTPDRLCNYFNGPWLAFTGRTLEQELGNGWTEGVHPEDFQRCLDIYVAAFDKRESFNMEYRLRHHSGEYRWIVDQGTPRHDSHGAFLGYIGHCLDVHQRKRAEDELLAKTEYLDAMFNNTSTIMLLVNAEGNVVDVNLAAVVMVGQPREALQGHLGGEVLRCVSSFLDGGCGHTEDCPTCPVRTRVMRTFSTGERSFNEEGSLTLAVDGKPVTIHFLISTALIRTRDGDFVLVSLIDITERKLAEEALRQNQEFTRIVMENLPIGLAVNSIDPS
ncbi:MAG: transporter substrate-binding domain-containing protein, partial [Humidesulfovibrio sp.]|nr:transporter substrate-binding domain-containing protein [Humidesulfovibrio sp.]